MERESEFESFDEMVAEVDRVARSTRPELEVIRREKTDVEGAKAAQFQEYEYSAFLGGEEHRGRVAEVLFFGDVSGGISVGVIEDDFDADMKETFDAVVRSFRVE